MTTAETISTEVQAQDRFYTTEDFEKVGTNLWKRDGKHYRLFAHSVTPNGCWLASPYMQQLNDIDTATGLDVFGNSRLHFESCGTLPAEYDFITWR